MTEFFDPTRYTRPLNPRADGSEFDGCPVESDGYALIALIEKYLTVQPDVWQKRFLVRALELKDGKLRFRRILLSVARRNGKSELISWLCLYALLQHPSQGDVIGIAVNQKSAKIIYDRVYDTIKSSKTLVELFRVTSSRGMKNLKTGAKYETFPSKSSALQGHDIDALGIIDEVHEVLPELWTDMVNSAAHSDEALIVGLTTAGDNNSDLLKRLYATAETELDNPATRDFFAIYEGIEGRPVDDVESLLQANPAYACGRLPISNLLDEIKGQAPHEVYRYRHNLFVKSSNPFVPVEAWASRKGDRIEHRDGITYGFDVTPGWGFGCVTAARRNDDGTVATEVVASLINPTLDQFKTIADALTGSNRAYAMDTMQLKDLLVYLKDKGRTAYDMNQGGYLRAVSYFYGAVMQGTLTHADDPILNSQIAYAKTRNVAGGMKLETSTDNDAVRATMWATYIASTRKNKVPQLL